MKTTLRFAALAIALASFSAFADSLRSDRHLLKIEAQAHQYNVRIFDAESRQHSAHLRISANDDTPAEAETTANGMRYTVRIEPHGTSYQIAFTADDGAGGIDSMRGGFTQRAESDGKPASAPVRAGRDVQEPKVLRRVEPVYTEDARAAGTVGTVVLEVQIDRSGFVRDAKVVKSMGYGLDESAADAVKQWQFEPSMQGRTPAEVIEEVTIELKP